MRTAQWLRWLAQYRCGWHTVGDHGVAVAEDALTVESDPVVVLGID